MFVQCNVDQATDHCAAMHVKGWLFCWLSKHNTPVEFSQGLVQSLRKTPIYETIRVSEDLSFSLLYTAGDHKTAVVLGCDPRSSEGMSTFNRTLEWAKLNELALEIAPNITDYDEQTRHLLAELGLSTAHPGALKTCAICGETVSGNALVCPKCGRGVFESEKLHRDSPDTAVDQHTRGEGRPKGILDRLFKRATPAEKTPGDRLRVGMSYDEVVRLLGEPSKVNPGTEMLEMGPRGMVVGASEETRAQFSRTKYCMWKRPEGTYLLTIEDGKLASIYQKP